MATQGRPNRLSIVQSMGLGDWKAPPEPVASPPTFQHRMSSSNSGNYTDCVPKGRLRKDSNASRATSISQRTARRQGLLDGAVPAAADMDRKSSSLSNRPSTSRKRLSLLVNQDVASSPASLSPTKSSVAREPSSKRRPTQIDGLSVDYPTAVSRTNVIRDTSSSRSSTRTDRAEATAQPSTLPRDPSSRRRSTHVDRTSRRQSLQLGRPSASQLNLPPPDEPTVVGGIIPISMPILNEPQPMQPTKKTSDGGLLYKLFGKGGAQKLSVKKSSPAPSDGQIEAPENHTKPELEKVVPRPTSAGFTSLKARKAGSLTAGREVEESDDEMEFKSIVEPSVVAFPPEIASVAVSPEPASEPANGGALRELFTSANRNKQSVNDVPAPTKAVDLPAVEPKKKRPLFFNLRRKTDKPQSALVDDSRRRRYNAPAVRDSSSASVISVGGMTELAYVSDDSQSVISVRPLGLGRMSPQDARARRYRSIEPKDTIQEAEEEDAASVSPPSRRVSRDRPRSGAKNRSSLSRDRPLPPILSKAPATSSNLVSSKDKKRESRGSTLEFAWTDDEDDFDEANDDNFTTLEASQSAEPADVHDDDNVAAVLLRGESLATLGPHLSTEHPQDEEENLSELSSEVGESEHGISEGEEPEIVPVVVSIPSQKEKTKRKKKSGEEENPSELMAERAEKDHMITEAEKHEIVPVVVSVPHKKEKAEKKMNKSAEPLLRKEHREAEDPAEAAPEVEAVAVIPVTPPKKAKKKTATSATTPEPKGKSFIQPHYEATKAVAPAEEEQLPVYDEKLAKSAPTDKVDSKGRKSGKKTALAGMGGLLGGDVLGSVIGNSSKRDDRIGESPLDRKDSDNDLPAALNPHNYDHTNWGSDGDDDYFSDNSDSEAAVVAAPNEPVPPSTQRSPSVDKATAPFMLRTKNNSNEKGIRPISFMEEDSDYGEYLIQADDDLPQRTTPSPVSSRRKPVPPVVQLPEPKSQEPPKTRKLSLKQKDALDALLLSSMSASANETASRKVPVEHFDDQPSTPPGKSKTYNRHSASLKKSPSPAIGQIYHDPAKRGTSVSPTRDMVLRQEVPRREVPTRSGTAFPGGSSRERTESLRPPEKPLKSSARALAKKQPTVDNAAPTQRSSTGRKKITEARGGAEVGAAGALLAADHSDEPAVLSTEDEDRLGELRPLKRQFSNKQKQRSSAAPVIRKPSQRPRIAARSLNPTQRHYLLKSLVCIQLQSEWEELEKLGALTKYGFPFSLDRPELTRVNLNLKNEYTTGDDMDDEDWAGDPYANEDRDEARRLENLQQPYILRHLFHTHLTTFPGLKEAPVRWWQQRIQVFFDELAARNFSTSLERSEYTKRRFFSLALTRYLGVYFARGIGVRGPSELRGPGPGEPGSEKWGVGKQWGKGTVKRGLDQPARIDPALWKRIDNLFGDGEEGRVWRRAGKESTRVRGDWQAWKEQIIENEEGLDETVNFLDVSKIRNLPPKYRNAEEWARNHAAYLLHSLFVSSPQADSVFEVLKGIHALFPYWGAKQLLKYTNAQVLIEGILNLLLARPAGAKSLIQRIAAYVIGSEATTLQKEFIIPLSKELADKELTSRIDDYVKRGHRPERHSLRSRAEKTGDDILTVILLAAAGTPLSREVQDKVIKMQHAFSRSPYRGNVDLAYPASTGYAKANPDKNSKVPTWDASRAEADAARKYAQLKLYLRDCLKKRDREEAVKMASGSLLPTIIKESLSIVFYDGVKEISRMSDLCARLGDLQAFIDDMIEVKKKKDDSIQAWVALAARHENSLYYIVHECASIAGPLFEWCQIGLDFMALSTSDPVHPADRSAKNIEVDLEEMLQDRHLTDRDVDLILEEVDELAVYTKWTKVAYELQLRQNYLLARPDAATASQLTEEDIPTTAMREEIRDIDTLMRELMEEEGVPIDDGALPNESRGTEAREQAEFWFDAIDPLGQHLKAEKESEELRYEPLTVTPPIPCLKYVRKLLPIFNEVLKSKLPDWERGDASGPRVVSRDGNGGSMKHVSSKKSSANSAGAGSKHRTGSGGR